MSERVDIDRLADYVGGALDGTPDAAEVRRLVDTDPEWAAAHEDLAAAMASVSVELDALGAADESVPEAVVARLDAVLHNLSSSDGTGSVNRAAQTAHGGPVAAGDGARADGVPAHPENATGRPTDRSIDRPADRAADPARPGGGRGGHGSAGSGPGRERRRRTARWAAGLSAAAAVIAFGIGVVATFPNGRSEQSADNAASAPEAPHAMASPAAGSGTVISGRDYRNGSFDGLTDVARAGSAPFGAADRSTREGAEANDVPATAGPPPELARFESPAAVEACLDAIRTMYGGVVQVVDLARYEGDPAVVVLLNGASAGGGRPLVVVAGPGCGQIPGDTDEVFHGPMG